MRNDGFTLIEVLVLIIVTSLLASVVMYGAVISLRNAPTAPFQLTALQTARQCMEAILMQKRLLGYSSFSCPSTLALSLCTAPTGYNVSASISCSSWNSDTQYQEATVQISGKASVSLKMLLANY